MGFIYGISIQGNLAKTYSLTSWLRQQSAFLFAPKEVLAIVLTAGLSFLGKEPSW